jgi:4-coumarate--CoA ligase
MIFTSSKEEVPIPNKDLLSWIFDEQKYDPDKPVGFNAM